ncbi:hypothetical protein [Plesiomonas shigelloides]|uniref:DUF3806 domain-containing protein n=1 Tax=Plesiomonas shigelloides TaxID=703 RepID=A0A8I1WAD9_PLESH|nr:hypothetical protein [Plesiomonas shigelloides]KAB7672706.1 hypothetical protein GBN18_00260 [Plesiomonas shigelloides]MBO1109821.1 hypothetical protein [Plesiomonas shigelloides]MCQ8860086.1 hypothetical protein [Plesiomonas shigelloides]QIY10417.1 hypothetical protein FOC33_16870 [Plesiomonas shigelloides]
MAEIRPIPKDVEEQIIELCNSGYELLAISETTSPSDVVAAITEFVRETKDRGEKLNDDQAYALGALLGHQYVEGLKWHWASVVWDSDEENGAIGVLNNDNSHFNNPIGWVCNIIDSDGGVPFMLSYNMILAGQVPPSSPNKASGLY